MKFRRGEKKGSVTTADVFDMQRRRFTLPGNRNRLRTSMESSNLNEEHIVHTGHLIKSPPLSKYFIKKSWHKRYFVLYDKGKSSFRRSESSSADLESFLIYYKTKGSLACIDRIPLAGATVCENANQINGQQFAIELQTRDRKYILCAETRTEHESWLQKLKDTVNRVSDVRRDSLEFGLESPTTVDKTLIGDGRLQAELENLRQKREEDNLSRTKNFEDDTIDSLALYAISKTDSRISGDQDVDTFNRLSAIGSNSNTVRLSNLSDTSNSSVRSSNGSSDCRNVQKQEPHEYVNFNRQTGQLMCENFQNNNEPLLSFETSSSTMNDNGQTYFNIDSFYPNPTKLGYDYPTNRRSLDAEDKSKYHYPPTHSYGQHSPNQEDTYDPLPTLGRNESTDLHNRPSSNNNNNNNNEDDKFYHAPPSTTRTDNDKEFYDVPPSSIGADTEEVYDIPPSSTRTETEEVYDIPPSSTRTDSEELYDILPTSTGGGTEELYDFPPNSPRTERKEIYGCLPETNASNGNEIIVSTVSNQTITHGKASYVNFSNNNRCQTERATLPPPIRPAKPTDLQHKRFNQIQEKDSVPMRPPKPADLHFNTNQTVTDAPLIKPKPAHLGGSNYNSTKIASFYQHGFNDTGEIYDSAPSNNNTLEDKSPRISIAKDDIYNTPPVPSEESAESLKTDNCADLADTYVSLTLNSTEPQKIPGYNYLPPKPQKDNFSYTAKPLPPTPNEENVKKSDYKIREKSPPTVPHRIGSYPTKRAVEQSKCGSLPAYYSEKNVNSSNSTNLRNMRETTTDETDLNEYQKISPLESRLRDSDDRTTHSNLSPLVQPTTQGSLNTPARTCYETHTTRFKRVAPTKY